MKRKLTANILIYAIILMMIPIHTLAEPKLTPQPIEQVINETNQQEPSPTDTPAPELEPQDPNITYAVPGEAPAVDYSMLDYYNNNYNSMFGQEPEEEPLEETNTQNGNPEVDDNDPSINESDTENLEPTTFDSPYNQINNQNENITLNQGSLNISNTILSLPGKNGLDLTLNLTYNSDSAVLNSPLYYYPGSTRYDYSGDYFKFKVASQNCFFAPGWELTKSYISWKNTEDLYTIGTNADTLHLADGRTYQISGSRLLGLKTGDIAFSKNNATDPKEIEYTVTYKDGRIETFDWRGCLIKESDRYGNHIDYFYEEEQLFRLNYKTYVSNPSVYSRTFPTLYKIRDSLEREIFIDRDVQSDPLGNSIQAVHFTMDGKRLATANFSQQTTMYGPVSVLNSIDTYCRYTTTQEMLVNTISYQYQELISSENKEAVFIPCAKSAVALNQINYPTGAQSQYAYQSYKETTFNGLDTGSSETYKISSRWDIIDQVESGRKNYEYINNSSGYPFKTKNVLPDSNGEIDGSFRYFTLVSEPLQNSEDLKNTLYTFDGKHLKINEECYLSSADNQQEIKSLQGAADNSHYAYNGQANKLYRVYTAASRLVIERIGEEEEIENLIDFGTISTISENNLLSKISAVKTYHEYLLIFCSASLDGLASKKMMIKYDTQIGTYECVDLNDSSLSLGREIIYGQDTFYFIGTDIIHALRMQDNTLSTVSVPPLSGYTIQKTRFLAEYNGTFYYQISYRNALRNTKKIYSYGNRNWTELSSYEEADYDGFADSSGFYILSGSKIKLYNANTFSVYMDLLDGVSTVTCPFIHSGGEIYVIKQNGYSCEELYRLDLQNKKWIFVTTLLMKSLSEPYSTYNQFTTPLSDGQNLFFFPGYRKDYLNTTYSNGYEKINPYQVDYTHRTTSITTYDEFKMPESSSVTNYGPAGQKNTKTTTTVYNYYKNLVSQTDSLGRQTTYTYDQYTAGNGYYHLPTQIVQNVGTDKEITTTNTLSGDRKNITLSTVNYGDGKLLHTKNEYSTASPGNVIRQITYETSEETPLNVTEYEYSADYGEAYVTKQTVKDAKVNSGDFTETTQSIVTQSTYDSFGRVATSTDALGRVTTNEYYSNGWLKKTTLPDGNYKEYTYYINHNGVNKVAINTSGQYTEDIYDNMGRIKEQKVPDTENVLQTAGTYAYNVNGKLYQQTDLYTRLTYTFDYLGRTTQLTTSNPDGTGPVSKTVAYDDYLQKQIVTDENGKSSMTYLDDAGRKVEDWQKQPVTENGTTTDQFVKVAAYTYDVADNVVSVTDANGNSVTNQYDRQGNLLQTTDAKNQTTNCVYDIKNNLLQMATPGGSVYTYQYDDLNRVTKGTDAVSESSFVAYDAAGRTIKSKDRNGVITTNIYKENSDLITSTTSGEITTSFTYDYFGYILEATDQTGKSLYTYHDNKKLERITKPDGKYISYTYDVLGNVTSVTDYDGQTKFYTYEKGGKLKSISSSLTGPADATYHYNDNGSLSHIEYANGLKTLYSYDSANRVSQVQNKVGDTIQNTYQYTYDPVGNQITKEETGADGTVKTSTYAYDELNRIQSEADPSGMVKAYAYDANNNIQTVTATAPSNELAAAPVVPEVQNPESTEAGNPLSASLNLASNLNETSETSNAAQSAQNAATVPENYVITYTYDANNRMTKQEKAGNGIESVLKMGYDKNGNMTSRQRSSVGGPVGDNTNMEVSIGTMQSNPGSESVAETFSYNALNQMVGYQNSNGTNASYAYDATGMRTSKTVNGVEKKFYYDGMFILNEGDGTNITATNLIGLTGIEGRKNGADEMAYFMKDAHGDVISAVGSNGTALASYEYDIWGNQMQESANTYDNPFRYCSEYMDEESGLIYLRARFYDPSTGRFTQEDPSRDGLNWYAYCGSNPIMFYDFSGLSEGQVQRRIDDTVIDFMLEYMPLTIENGCEYGALIYEVEVDGVIGYTYTLVLIGDTRNVFIDRAFAAVPKDAKVVGIMHTHPPDGSPYFSPYDRDKAKQHDIPIYLGNKAGVVMKYDPKTKEEYLVTTGLYRTEVYESKSERENYKNQQIIQGEHVSLPDDPQYELIRKLFADNRQKFLNNWSGGKDICYTGDKLMGLSPISDEIPFNNK